LGADITHQPCPISQYMAKKHCLSYRLRANTSVAKQFTKAIEEFELN